MDEARHLLERFERIEALERTPAARPALLAELRALVAESEAWGGARARAPRADTRGGRTRTGGGRTARVRWVHDNPAWRGRAVRVEPVRAIRCGHNVRNDPVKDFRTHTRTSPRHGDALASAPQRPRPGR